MTGYFGKVSDGEVDKAIFEAYGLDLDEQSFILKDRRANRVWDCLGQSVYQFRISDVVNRYDEWGTSQNYISFRKRWVFPTVNHE